MSCQKDEFLQVEAGSRTVSKYRSCTVIGTKTLLETVERVNIRSMSDKGRD